jgi:hypothetical protein
MSGYDGQENGKNATNLHLWNRYTFHLSMGARDMWTRVLLAGLLGGLAMFVWSAAMHMSPLGMAGIQYLPRELIVVETLAADSAGLRDGMYVFPADGAAGRPDQPSGMLVYHPANMFTMMTRQIQAEAVKQLVQATMLAYLLVRLGGGFARMAGFAAVVGAMVALTSNGSYAIWYGMPVSYTLVAMFIEFVAYVLAGAAIALVIGRRVQRGPAAA